ncbi:clathrin interactor EPSIN 2-like [Phragmites australis]|uniref:clathrin interactor EPSIN 2-like n=1 Tax=Phragmites australis TaxID=29695 RepID=UPI002D7931E1|nr:clathrin interactor EPSIN 2-like [Phragmites australis]
MKKVFDQTVRDLKREVNKKVLKVPGIEQKILDATSNEPWGPHGSLLADIAQATQNYHEYQMIMNIVWKRINDTGKNWRHVYKGLIVLDYLVAHGTERVIDDIREHAYQISALADFQYIDSAGRDQGSNVRRKSQSLVSLVNDKERIQEVRQKALATRDKYRSAFATSGTHRSPGGYGGGYDNDRYEGGRYDNRNGYGREREYGYRDDDRYGGPGDTPNREGDRYSRDSNERYGRDYREDEFKGSGSNHEYAEGSGRRSYGRERDSYGDDEAYSSRGRGNNADGTTQDERPIERKLSNQQIASPPPNYEDVTRDGQDKLHDDRNGASVPAAVPKVSSPSVSRTTVPAGQVNCVHDNAVEDVPAPPAAHAEPNGFDEFDPRGSIPDSSPAVNPSPVVNSLEMDLFGSDPMSSLALVSVPQPTTTANVEPPTNSGFETNSFMGMPPTSTGFGEIDASNPFGDPTPFKAVHEESPAVSQTNAAPAGSFQATRPGADANPFQPASVASFGFGDTLGDPTFASSVASEQQDIFANTTSLPSEVSPANPSAVPQQSVQTYVPSQAPQPAVAGPSPVTHAAPTTFSPQAPQAMAPNPHAIPQAVRTFTYLQAPHSAPANSSPIPQAVPTSFAPSQVPQPAAAPNLPSGQSNFFMQPASGAGIDSLSGVPTQNGAPSYFPSQPSQLTALANQQLSQPNFLPQTGTSAPQPALISRGSSQPLGVPNSMPSGANFSLQLSSASPPETIISALQVSQTEPVKKFEPRSTVWADTLSRGLVDLNISGPKANPHADIGVDFDSINRKEKRQEKKTNQPPLVSTVTMGKAMGAGSGIGRAGAGVVAPPSNPMGAGRGMGMGAGYGGGMGMNRPMGMGMGMGMIQQQPMGMGMGMIQQQPMGMNQGMPMRPPMGMGPGGMPGGGYNPMGTAYGGQQPYGGYR